MIFGGWTDALMDQTRVINVFRKLLGSTSYVLNTIGGVHEGMGFNLLVTAEMYCSIIDRSRIGVNSR